jgi:hypothetical protein
MKKIITLCMLFVSVGAFAAEGTVVTEAHRVFRGALSVTIYGTAAMDISTNLSRSKVKYELEPFSQKFIQRGDGISCIRDTNNSRPYCYLKVARGGVN